MIVYRIDVFQELGLKAPQNWDDIVKAVGDQGRQARHDAVPRPGRRRAPGLPWDWGAGGEVATEKGGTWTSELDSAKSQAGIQFYTDLATKHGFSSAGATTWKETDLRDACRARSAPR